MARAWLSGMPIASPKGAAPPNASMISTNEFIPISLPDVAIRVNTARSVYFVTLCSMKEEAIRKEQGARLAAVRQAAGFMSARDAALSCRWPESTYRAHENGSRTIGFDDAAKYVARFRVEGAKGFSAKWVLFGSDEEESLDEMIRNQPPDIRQKAYYAVRSVLKK